ncbi:MAG: glycosyltransferase [Verrucomicrobia bacterium]|nr:glycosyltransferase [Cytophagales bacterium]
MKKPLKFIFIVQGEGRGHLTQAIALKTILTQAGHSLACVLVGKSERRIIPAFFEEKINVPIHGFESPNFVADAQNRGINIPKSISFNLAKIPVFLQSLKLVRKIIASHQPDVIVNFYDLLGGTYNLIYKNKNIRFLTIGHQYFLEHSSFTFPIENKQENKRDRFLLLLSNRLTAFGSSKKLALSFRQENDEPDKKIVVVPPLLRQEVKTLLVENHGHILIYLNMPGYAEEIISWHQQNTTVPLHCFWDKKDAEDGWQPHPNLTFHQINDQKFLEMMRTCNGYMSTAGFESVCEAMYLGKAVMMGPVEGQFEQACNAVDALKSGAGIIASSFDVGKFLDYLPKHQDKQADFRSWLEKAEGLFLKHLED